VRVSVGKVTLLWIMIQVLQFSIATDHSTSSSHGAGTNDAVARNSVSLTTHKLSFLEKGIKEREVHQYHRRV
jgi:hypothetical protein